MKFPSLEEQQAITRLKQGDLGGMETLVRHYQVQAVYAAYLIVRDLNLAEDIVQNTFIQTAQKIHQFDEHRPFGAWFMRSVVNAAIKADKQQRRFVPLDPHENGDIDPMIDWLLDPKPGPDQIIETEETRQMVWKALESLSVEQRAAIIMRHFLEMNETEMTQELSRPLTTIRWWLRTARNKLREALEPLWQMDHSDNDERKVQIDE
jgi:RNA polymerase sigma-70 factor (ECF subfamily)